MELSAVIITYNEARRLSPTLAALSPVVDEIVIVDSGSTDDTREVALQFEKVRWYERPFRGYGDQKNYANSLARGRYILSIDADEVLSPELQESILREKGGWRAAAYEVLRVAVYCGAFIRAGEWYPDWKIRLFARELAFWDDAPVHEKLILRKSVRPLRLSGELWHYTYASIEESIERSRRYAYRMAVAAYTQGKPASWRRPFLKGTVRFLKGWLLKGGWRLGWRGWAISLLGAWTYFLRELYLAQLYEQGLKPETSSSLLNTKPEGG
ncbi:MAG: glycosyltransferase family 2 protein [Bacteroidia bacterium]|nr:glycosyltransferase family 2 protein [Bacteroidia bacterium]MDW8236542.1 glycosyltransferase family 2 protein [Bacteroidia bacterium]